MKWSCFQEVMKLLNVEKVHEFIYRAKSVQHINTLLLHIQHGIDFG